LALVVTGLTLVPWRIQVIRNAMRRKLNGRQTMRPDGIREEFPVPIGTLLGFTLIRDGRGEPLSDLNKQSPISFGLLGTRSSEPKHECFVLVEPLRLAVLMTCLASASVAATIWPYALPYRLSIVDAAADPVSSRLS